MADFDRESMLEMFNYEMNQLIESLETTVLEAEDGITTNHINEIFRIMHTIKGSAAMMLFHNIAGVAHAVEDMFFYLRDYGVEDQHNSNIADLVFEGMDFIKQELEKIESGEDADGQADEIVEKLQKLLSVIKGEDDKVDNEQKNDNVIIEEKECNTVDSKLKEHTFLSSYMDEDFEVLENANNFSVRLVFDEDTQMVNVRAYSVISNFEDVYESVVCEPEDLLGEEASDIINKNGLVLNIEAAMDFQSIFREMIKVPYLTRVSLKEIVLGTLEESEPVGCYEYGIEFPSGFGENFANMALLINELEFNVSALEILDVKYDSDDTKALWRVFTKKSFEEINEIISSINVLTVLTSEEVYAPKIQAQEEEKDQNTKLEQSIEIKQTESEEVTKTELKQSEKNNKQQATKKQSTQQFISVNINKLDVLLNLMGELVISEAMVTQNPDLDGLDLQNFSKESRQLRKIINDVQDVVMSMRMVPLSTVFLKMHRIVRDMSKSLNKDVNLNIIGEETEVDKNIVELISDPLMHMIRNSVDHGLEKTEEDRIKAGKPPAGTVTLEAKNSGGDVLVIVKDDGLGVNTDVVYEKAKKNGLIDGERYDYTDKELNMLIFEPGFSTNAEVTNYSGRGVGMDVVNTNLQSVGGSVDVISEKGVGTQFILKIPLTLAIIEGMNIKIGGDMYTIPIISIRQSFKAKNKDITLDPEGNEMIKVRGEMYNLIRLYEYFDIETNVKESEDGIFILVENGDEAICLFADELVGEHQVVVKTMPKLINKVRALAGCTLLGNGDISLIVDVAGFFGK